ncbi:MAG: LamG domain-containing protein, partial [Betaproteobacteria bacterium]|nr:LamG domain-containing protein [Betaproteobacteria bacterium]
TNYFQPSAAQSPKGNSYTVCFWMRPDSLGANNVQLVRQSYNNVSGTANVDLDLLPDGSLSFGQMQTTTTGDFHSVRSAPQTVLASNWYHVAMVRDATNAALGLYLNGRSVATTNTYGILSPTVTPALGFAAQQDALNNDGNTVRFKGAVDDVRVYWTALNSNQVATALSAGLSKTAANSDSALVFYAPMEGTAKGSLNTTSATNSGTLSTQSALPTPILSWTPSPINLIAPAVLSTNELTASARASTGGPVAGSWTYSPAAGASLSAGTNAVVGTFVPTDLNSYSIGTITNQIVVAPAAKLNPTVTVNVGSYTYNGSLQGPGVSEVNKGGSTGSVTLQYG